MAVILGEEVSESSFFREWRGHEQCREIRVENRYCRSDRSTSQLWRWFIVVLCVAGSAILAGSGFASAQSCDWAPGFFSPDVHEGDVEAVVSWDDGNGAAVYVSGGFDVIGGVVANNIARWDGSEWHALTGSSGSGTDGFVRAMTVYGGDLIVAGSFDEAGGLVANNIARWDGSEWHALIGSSGTGVQTTANAVIPHVDGSLYVGGYFDSAGGVTVNYIARWDGSEWYGLSGPSGTGLGGSADDFALYNDGGGLALFVCGSFSTAGGIAAKDVAKWDGSQWYGVGGGTDGFVYALRTWAGQLYAGGYFDNAGGVAASNIARWNGTAWSAVGSGLDHRVKALTAGDVGHGAELFAAGDFEYAGGTPVHHIARFNGSTWSTLVGYAVGLSDSAKALHVYDDGRSNALYAGGAFNVAGGHAARSIARYDSTGWEALAGPLGNGADSDVNAMVVHDDGNGESLFVGGDFETAGRTVLNHIGRWDGTAWTVLSEPLGVGVDSSVEALALFDDGGGEALYAGGSFDQAGGVIAHNVAMWDGNRWWSVGGGVTGHVEALAAYPAGAGSELYVAGSLSEAGGVPVSRIARWDGAQWRALGSGVNSSVYAMAVYDDGGGADLYVAGFFTQAGGIPVDRIARWDGAAWSALTGDGPDDDAVYALEVYDGDLYVGGRFSRVGGVIYNYIARWNAGGWSPVVSPGGNGVGGRVNVLRTIDDGAGDALYVGGGFDDIGGMTALRIARWADGEWSALGEGPISDVFAIEWFPGPNGPTLWAGGSFWEAGGRADNNFAAWVCAAIFADGFEEGGTSAWSVVVP